MKKFIIFLLLVGVSLLIADPIVIGEGEATNTHLPMEPYYGYTYSQEIYTADEIGGATDIENVAWHYNGNQAWTEDECVIYMGHTTMTDFGDTYPNWIPVENLTEVWRGPLTVLDFDHWVTVELDTVFPYNGTDNLVIAFDANTAGCTSNSDEFYGTATTLNRSIYYYSDSVNPDPANPPTSRGYDEYDQQEAIKTGKTLSRITGVSAFISNIILNNDATLPSGFVNGYVYDSETNQPIEGATVAVGNFLGDTDVNGFYEIEVMVEGEQTVTATHPDYLEADAGTVTVVFDQTVNLDIYMDFNDLEGDLPGTAYVIDAFPYFTTGDTSVNYTNFIGNDSPDVFYTFTISETSLLDLHTCGSTFDTYLRLYDDTLTEVASDDDGCNDWPTGLGSASWIEDGDGVTVPAGTYYVCVEGFSDNEGYYELTVNELVPPEYGSLEGTITDAVTEHVIPGAEVTIGELSATTDESGYYIINDIETGTYDVSVTADTYNPGNATEIEIIADHTATLDLALQPILYGDIDGTITDLDSGSAIEGAEVTIDGNTVTTDTNGYYIVTDLVVGTYDIDVLADGYFAGNETGIEVVAGQTTTVDIALSLFDDIGDTLDNPIVVDAFPYFMSGNMTPYTDYSSSLELENDTSGADIFYQLDLPNGATAELHGCGSEFDTYMNLYDDDMTLVAYDDDGCGDWPSGSSLAPWIGQDQGTYNVILSPGTYYLLFEAYSSNTTLGYFEVHLDISDPPVFGAVEGNVTDAYSTNPIVGATVTCGEQEAVTDEFGNYLIEGLLEGDYELTCTADGYEVATPDTITIIPGDTITHDFALDILVLVPENLTANVNGYNVDLTWEAPGTRSGNIQREHSSIREFTGTYNVYRNDELVATVSETNYTDMELSAGFYEYYVTSIYDEGESLASNIVEVAVGNAEISVDPAEFDVVLNPDGTLDQNLSISNNGDLGLDYQAEIYYTSTRFSAQVYPASEEYWTGTTDYTNFIENSVVNATPGNEAWMMFDVSSIPDVAVINSIECYVYVSDTNYPYWSLTPCNLDPLTASADSLANLILAGNGTDLAYSYNNETSTFPPGWHNYTLGGTSAEDLTDALIQNWFAIGVSPRDSGTSYYTIIDGWNETNPPYLVIDYTIPVDPWVTFDGDMGVTGVVEAGADPVLHNLHFDAAGFTEGDMVTGYIEITSNDQTNSELIVPLTMTVGAGYNYGDVTDDGSVDAFDSATILQYAVGIDPVAAPLPWTWELIAGDVDGNGTPEAFDAALVLQYAVGIISQFPVESRVDAPTADVDVNVVAGSFIFSTNDDLYGFSVAADTDLLSFGNTEIEYMHAVNGNAVALASAEAINGEFLSIPFEKLADEGEFELTMSINGETRSITYRVEDLETAPVVNAVLGNYPNPFNPSTMIKLQVKEESPVTVNIYNVKGQLVKKLVNETVSMGIHSFEWSGTDDRNRPVSSGVYFYNVKIGSLNETNKMIMLK